MDAKRTEVLDLLTQLDATAAELWKITGRLRKLLGNAKMGGHSASVEIYLIIGEERFPARRVSHERIVLEEAVDIQAKEAKVLVVVDGVEFFTPAIIQSVDGAEVRLVHG